MYNIQVRNVETALLVGLKALHQDAVRRDSRNGPVLVFPTPVSTMYSNPTERVVLLPERDCNPFFHFMEGLWMLAGRDDVEWISRFSSNIANYSDDGVTFHGAYGHRWRRYYHDNDGYSIDQIDTAIKLLKANPDDRRVVIQMWDSSSDLDEEGKDFPCNLIIIPRINPDGALDMTVFNRSNDMIWGAYGANAVHMSMLQEYMALCIGVPVGSYWQVSTNFHAYENVLEKHAALLEVPTSREDRYASGEVESYPLIMTDKETWDSDLRMFMSEGSHAMGYRDGFFRRVAVPMLQTWEAWKNREDSNFKEKALRFANDIAATDWRAACVEWMERR